MCGSVCCVQPPTVPASSGLPCLCLSFPITSPAPRSCGEPSGTRMPGAADQHMQPHDVGPRSESHSGPQSQGPGDPPGQSGSAGALATLPQENSTITPRRISSQRALGLQRPGHSVGRWELGGPGTSHSIHLRARRLHPEDTPAPAVTSPACHGLLWPRGAALVSGLQGGLVHCLQPRSSPHSSAVETSFKKWVQTQTFLHRKPLIITVLQA